MEVRPFHAELIDERVLVVSGLLDEIAAPELGAALRSATHDYTREVVVELTDIDFLPSVAISLLLEGMRETAAHGARVILEAQRCSMAARVLDMCGIDFETPEDGPWGEAPAAAEG